MNYEWDSKKDEANLSKHGFSLSLAIFVFKDKNRIQVIDSRKDYGETRYLTYGLIEKRLFCVCWTQRDDAIRIISVHPVHKSKKGRYYDNYQND